MINQKSIEAVNSSKFSQSFRKPLYNSYSFSNIPGTIEKLLTNETSLTTLPSDVLLESNKTYDTVMLFFVDAFGWRFFERYQDRFPTLKRFIDRGTVSKITSQFPSTTSAHVTTIHSGQRVDQTGIFEWFYYEPLLDDMISPLPFAYAGEGSNSLLRSGVDPVLIYPTENIFKQYARKGVETHVFQSALFTPSTYGKVLTDGVTQTHAFTDFRTALQDIKKLIQTQDGVKRYVYCYYGDIDSTGHEHGSKSPEFDASVATFFSLLEENLFTNLINPDGKTLVIMTADHGQTEIDPATTIYINKVIPEMETWIKRNQHGKAMMPGGSARDLFVYIKDEYLDVAYTTLTEKLVGIAEVYKTEELLQAGLFGDSPSNLLRNRLSNICILPYKNDSVYWYEAGKFEQEFFGHHGGLTPEEMESIFLTLEL